jgi:hypothetical protein
MARKKLTPYTKVGDKVVTLLHSDAERILALLYQTSSLGDKFDNEALKLIKLLERENNRYGSAT